MLKSTGAMKNTAEYLRGYAPIGQRVQKFKANMLSAISNRGKVRLSIYDKISPDVLIDFMCRLVTDTKRKVLLSLKTSQLNLQAARPHATIIGKGGVMRTL